MIDDNRFKSSYFKSWNKDDVLIQWGDWDSEAMSDKQIFIAHNLNDLECKYIIANSADRANRAIKKMMVKS